MPFLGKGFLWQTTKLGWYRWSTFIKVKWPQVFSHSQPSPHGASILAGEDRQWTKSIYIKHDKCNEKNIVKRGRERSEQGCECYSLPSMIRERHLTREHLSSSYSVYESLKDWDGDGLRHLYCIRNRGLIITSVRVKYSCISSSSELTNWNLYFVVV